MKRLLYAFIFVMMLLSCAKETGKNAIVNKNCTGTYLKVNNKEYKVCNFEIAESFEDGTEVKAKFNFITKCDDSHLFLCEMLYKSNGWINIKEINK